MQRTWWPEAGTIIVTGPYWTLEDNFKWSLNSNETIFWQENWCKTAVGKMVAILSWLNHVVLFLWWNDLFLIPGEFPWQQDWKFKWGFAENFVVFVECVLCSQGFNWKYANIASNNELALNRWWAIIWTSDGLVYLDSKVHGANMEPIWGRQEPGGPMLAPWTLLSGYWYIYAFLSIGLDGLMVKCQIHCKLI